MCSSTTDNADNRADLVDQEQHTSITEADELPLVNIQVVKKQPSEPSMTVEPVELDSGAPFSFISQTTFLEYFASTKLTPSSIRLKTYTGEKLKVLGELSARVWYNGQDCLLPLLVVSRAHRSKLAAENIQLWIHQVYLYQSVN